MIEWDDASDAATMVSAREPIRASNMGRMIATMVGALAAIAVATWGLRHLRAA